MEMSILLKEHFNRWYSLKAYYTTITLLDLPISVSFSNYFQFSIALLKYNPFQIVGSFLFTVIIYYWSHQPLEWSRFLMFFAISTLVVFVGQSFGLMVGAWFNVVV